MHFTLCTFILTTEERNVGKTKTAVISGVPEEVKSGREAYEAKKRKQAEKKAQEEKKKKQVTKVGLKGGERIKVVEAAIPEKQGVKEEAPRKQEKETKRKPKERGKKYKSAKNKIDRNKLYKLPAAIKLVKETSYSKFEGTIELHLTIKKKGVNINIALPHSTGKAKKIEVADDKTIEKLKKGKIDFDILLATSDMMPKLVPFAKLLGPKGLMPNPKNGTLIKNAKDKEKFSGNTFSLKTEKSAPLIHTIIGKVNTPDKELLDNLETIVDAVNRRQILKAYLASTMGPSVKLDLS